MSFCKCRASAIICRLPHPDRVVDGALGIQEMDLLRGLVADERSGGGGVGGGHGEYDLGRLDHLGSKWLGPPRELDSHPLEGIDRLRAGRNAAYGNGPRGYRQELALSEPALVDPTLSDPLRQGAAARIPGANERNGTHGVHPAVMDGRRW